MNGRPPRPAPQGPQGTNTWDALVRLFQSNDFAAAIGKGVGGGPSRRSGQQSPPQAPQISMQHLPLKQPAPAGRIPAPAARTTQQPQAVEHPLPLPPGFDGLCRALDDAIEVSVTHAMKPRSRAMKRASRATVATPIVIVTTPEELARVVRAAIDAAFTARGVSTNHTPSEWIDAKTAASILGVSTRQVAKLAASANGRPAALCSARVGRLLRFRRTDVLAILEPTAAGSRL